MSDEVPEPGEVGDDCCCCCCSVGVEGSEGESGSSAASFCRDELLKEKNDLVGASCPFAVEGFTFFFAEASFELPGWGPLPPACGWF